MPLPRCCVLAGPLLVAIVTVLAVPTPAFADDGDDDYEVRANLPDPPERRTAGASHDGLVPPWLEPDFGVWTLIGTAGMRGQRTSRSGALGEAGFEFGIGSQPRPDASAFPVVRIGLGIGFHGYQDPDGAIDPTAAVGSLNLLLGIGGTANPGVFQIGIWLRGELASEDLRFDDGGAVFGDGREAWSFGAFARWVVPVGDLFTVPVGIYGSATISGGERSYLLGLDLAGLVGLVALILYGGAAWAGAAWAA